MNRSVLVTVAIAALIVPARAADPPSDVQFHQMLQRTGAAAGQLEFTRMLIHIVRKGADMGNGDGWFTPSQGRYTWSWLSGRCDGKQRISPKDFNGPPELFARLDRDRDGFLSPADFDWSDSSPYFRQLGQAQQWLRLRAKDGKISRKEWDDLFQQLARDKDYLNADDIRALFNPPLPPQAPRKPGPGEGPPSKALLLQGLFSGEIGSMFEGPQLNQKAPDFTLPSHDGKRFITLSQVAQDKPVVLIFGSFT